MEELKAGNGGVRGWSSIRKKLAYGRGEWRVIVGAMVRKRELFSLIQLGAR